RTSRRPDLVLVEEHGAADTADGPGLRVARPAAAGAWPPPGADLALVRGAQFRRLPALGLGQHEVLRLLGAARRAARGSAARAADGGRTLAPSSVGDAGSPPGRHADAGGGPRPG